MKILIATSLVLSERAADGAKHLTIGSNTEQIIIEFSPQIWERLGNTAKWFFTNVTEAIKTADAVEETEKETDVQVREVPEFSAQAEEDRDRAQDGDSSDST